MPHPAWTRSRRPFKPAALALAVVASGAAWAEQDPYYIGASLGATHHSNVFQSAGAQSDTVTSAGLLGGLDLHPGRQHVYATGTAQTNRYQKFDQLNNVSYGLNAGLDWQTIERLSGSLRYSANQNLVNYADVQFPVGTKDVQKTQQSVAAIRYGITPSLGVEGSVSHRTIDYSAEEDKRDYKSNSASLGLRWGGTGLLSFGAALRVTKNDFPTALVVAPLPATPPFPAVPAAYAHDESDRKDLDLTGSWTPSGLSVLSARVSLSRETHSHPAIPKFSGVTGSLTWDYRPTGKLSLATSLIRDTGAETTFLSSNFNPLRADNDHINTVLDVQAKWEATAKIVVNAGLRHSDGAVVDSIGVSRNASTNNLSLGASYTITRSIDLGCSLGYEQRSSSYNASIVGCNGRITLR